MTGNSAGLRTVPSSRLSDTELRSSPRESHILLSLRSVSEYGTLVLCVCQDAPFCCQVLIWFCVDHSLFPKYKSHNIQGTQHFSRVRSGILLYHYCLSKQFLCSQKAPLTLVIRANCQLFYRPRWLCLSSCVFSSRTSASSFFHRRRDIVIPRK